MYNAIRMLHPRTSSLFHSTADITSDDSDDDEQCSDKLESEEEEHNNGNGSGNGDRDNGSSHGRDDDDGHDSGNDDSDSDNDDNGEEDDISSDLETNEISKERHRKKKSKYHLRKRLGFPNYEEESLRLLERQWVKKNAGKMEEANKVWSAFFMNKGGYTVTLHKVGKNMKKIVRNHPIPARHRPKVWFEIAGAKKKMIENEGYYQTILDVHANQESRAETQIDLDLSRTFPNHQLFCNSDSPGRHQMRRILIAFSWRNPYVAYCQSLNYIVGLLLLHFDEEEAFWMLVVILEEILPANFYSPQLKGLRVDSKVIDELIRDRLPRLHHHFNQISLDATAFVSGWFMRLYVDVFPIETSLRIWDCMFNEGSKILFRVALAYLKLHETQLLQLNHGGEVLHFLNNETAKMFDHNLLTKTMWSFYNLRRGTVDRLRDRFRPMIDNEEKEIARRRQAYNNKTTHSSEKEKRRHRSSKSLIVKNQSNPQKSTADQIDGNNERSTNISSDNQLHAEDAKEEEEEEATEVTEATGAIEATEATATTTTETTATGTTVTEQSRDQKSEEQQNPCTTNPHDRTATDGDAQC